MENYSKVSGGRLALFILLSLITIIFVITLPIVATFGMVSTFLLGYLVGRFWYTHGALPKVLEECDCKKKKTTHKHYKKDDSTKK